MKLAVLEADILRADLIDRYQGYGRMFCELFAQAAPHWQVSVFNVVCEHYPALDDFDAFLITGSKYDAFSDEHWIVRLREFCRDGYRQDKILLGICFGHQLVAHALGGRAERSSQGWGLGILTYQQCTQPSFCDAQGPVSLLASHQDQVTSLPREAHLLLASTFCPNAGFYIPGRVLCLQGHPEFSREYLWDLMEGRRGVIDAATFDEALNSLAEPHEGIRVAQWLVRFAEAAVAQRGFLEG